MKKQGKEVVWEKPERNTFAEFIMVLLVMSIIFGIIGWNRYHIQKSRNYELKQAIRHFSMPLQ